MDTAFPFGLPLPTAFYLTAYVVTLMIHVVFMNYVLAGTATLAVAYLTSYRSVMGDSGKILKEWLPLMLSGAITAGVAPLLFVQILYKREYYTANLLLFNRWMAILPVLIIGFYAMYLLKSRWLSRRPAWTVVVAMVPAVCVAFTGFSWTENHLLSVRPMAFWGEFYATQPRVYTEVQLVPRLLVWAFGSIPTMVLILAWQHWYRGTGRPLTLAQAAGLGLVLAGGAAAWYYAATNDTTRLAFVSSLAAPYFVAACLGMFVQAVVWGWVGLSGKIRSIQLLAASLGVAMTIGGMTVCREAVRIATLGPEQFQAHFPAHAEAFGKGGVYLFLAFFALNAVLITLVLWLVRHRQAVNANPDRSAVSADPGAG